MIDINRSTRARNRSIRLMSNSVTKAVPPTITASRSTFTKAKGAKQYREPLDYSIGCTAGPCLCISVILHYQVQPANQK